MYLLRMGDDTFALPSAAVRAVLPARAADVLVAGEGGWRAPWESHALPVVLPAAELGLAADRPAPQAVVLVVAAADAHVAVAVDDVIGQVSPASLTVTGPEPVEPVLAEGSAPSLIRGVVTFVAAPSAAPSAALLLSPAGLVACASAPPVLLSTATARTVRHLLVRIGAEQVAVPAAAVQHVDQLPVTELVESGAGVTVCVRDRTVPVVDLAAVLALRPPRALDDPDAVWPLVIVHAAGHALGLLVDAFGETAEVSADDDAPRLLTIRGVRTHRPDLRVLTRAHGTPVGSLRSA
jgi:chemotaxis signal transduction protein